MNNFNGGRFFHKWPEEKKSFLTFLKWQMTAERQPWPGFSSNFPQSVPRLDDRSSDISITFINHATVYVQHRGVRFLTDPHWSKRASPFQFMGPKRVFNPGVDIDKLPGLDFVLVSHNHYDHLDVPTLLRLSEIYNPTFYIPQGDRYLLKGIDSDKVIELDWWQSIDEKNDAKIIYVPVKHWSARGLRDRNKSLWGGFVYQNKQGGKIFFAGDTGYCSIFTELFEKYGSFDVSLLPIGSFEPRWFMKDAHMNPEEAVQAHLDLHSHFSLGIHWGLWQLTDEAIDAPIENLVRALNEKGIGFGKFETLTLGESKIIYTIDNLV